MTKGFFEETKDSKLEDMVDAQLELQAKITFDMEHTFLQRHGLNKPKSILDIGTGNGTYCCLLAQNYPDKKFHGVDFKPDMIERAKRNRLHYGITNVEFICGDVLEDISCKSNKQYDGILARYAAVHFSDVSKALSKLYGLLKKDGYIWLIDVDLGYMKCSPPHKAFETYIEGTKKLYNKYGLDGYIGSKLPKLLQNAGFGDIFSEPLPFSNRNVDLNDFRHLALHEIKLFNEDDPTSITDSEMQEIARFVESPEFSDKYEASYGVAMIAARKR